MPDNWKTGIWVGWQYSGDVLKKEVVRQAKPFLDDQNPQSK